MHKIKRGLFKTVYLLGLSFFSGIVCAAFGGSGEAFYVLGAVWIYWLTNENILTKMALQKKPVLS
jgi:hypothetical protein